MKIVLLVTVYNEERHIKNFLAHHERQGLWVYLLDNESTDRTATCAQEFYGRNLLHIETLPRPHGFDLETILGREEELATELDADWFVHVDADEFLVSGQRDLSLLDAFRQADRLGFNVVHFMEYVFVPTREHPDHENGNYLETMRWYYPFLPRYPHRRIAWKRQKTPVDLVSSGGHAVNFPGLRMYPRWLAMKHYIALSHAHACTKWVRMDFNPRMMKRGWGVERSKLTPESIVFPSENILRLFTGDATLNPDRPEKKHLIFALDP